MKYVIERQYLLPIYQHLVVEAGSAEEACRKAIEHDDWKDAKEDGVGGRETTITALRPIPERQEPEDLGGFLYDDKPEEATRTVPALFKENPTPQPASGSRTRSSSRTRGPATRRASRWR